VTLNTPENNGPSLQEQIMQDVAVIQAPTVSVDTVPQEPVMTETNVTQEPTASEEVVQLEMVM